MLHTQNQKVIALIPSVSKTTGGGTASATADTIGYDYATVIVNLSAYTTVSQATNPTIALSHSDTTDATNYGTIVANFGSDGSVSRQYSVYLDRTRVPLKRYIKLAVTNATAGTDNAMAVSGTLLLSRPEQSPANTTAQTGSTNDTVTIV
jgi:hypothetical protein